MSNAKTRADVLVVEQGLAETRTRAQALILAGEVVARLLNGGERRVDKPGEFFPDGVELRLKGEGLKYVSRGGLKLEKALEAFGLDVRGARCLDLGASTGGFTDCLLKRGASHVTAVDVGRGQLHESLRQNERVQSYERLNARELPAHLAGFDFVVADLSFISLTLVVPGVVDRVNEGGTLVVLVKPQFECGREHVEKGGVVRSPSARRDAVAKIRRMFEELGCEVVAETESPILGPAGNVEYLVAATRRLR